MCHGLNPNGELAKLLTESAVNHVGKDPAFPGSDQAILDGRPTDNQSISNLKVIFQ